MGTIRVRTSSITKKERLRTCLVCRVCYPSNFGCTFACPRFGNKNELELVIDNWLIKNLTIVIQTRTNYLVMTKIFVGLSLVKNQTHP